MAGETLTTLRTPGGLTVNASIAVDDGGYTRVTLVIGQMAVTRTGFVAAAVIADAVASMDRLHETCIQWGVRHE
jgi:hypothetical protein